MTVPSPAPPDTPVWYVSYGSNMSSRRFACYLQGGVPPGGSRHNPGARDPSPPMADKPVDLPGTAYFAIESVQWGGGVMFYDHESPGHTAARAYLVTAGQLCDVAAQEMYRDLADGHPLLDIDVTCLTGGRHRYGEGHYETLVEIGRDEGVPLLTFTSPHGAADVEHNRPSTPYLAMIAEGLRESRAWRDEQVAAYFESLLPGLGEQYLDR